MKQLQKLIGILIMMNMLAGTAAGKGTTDIVSYMLDNGMQVVVIPDHRAPVVTHMVWYRVGAADEKPGKSGIAHFLEHLMFKGTDEIAPGKFSKIIAANGGEDNAFTSQDYTAYFQRIARDRLELVMKMEADRMVNLKLDNKHVLPERDVILEERRQRTDNSPSARLSEQVSAALYLAHPYGKPIIGWENEMAGLTREDAIAFYKSYYTPNNAILVVAGDITVDEIKPLAKKHYGSIKQRIKTPARMRPIEPKSQAERRVILRDEKVRLPNIRKSYITPSYSTAKPGEGEALSVLSELLGDGATSRLYRDLIVERKLAAGASAYYMGSSLDSGVFVIYGAPNPGIGIEEIEIALDEAIALLLEKGVNEDELNHAKSKLIADHIYSRDSQTGMARVFGAALTTGQSVEDVLEWPERLKKVTVKEVNKAARKYLRPENSVTGVLLPEKKAKGDK